MQYRGTVLDDYQGVAVALADWFDRLPEVRVEFLSEPLGAQERVIEALREADIVCLMRERTPFPRAVIEALPRLKLLVTTGMRNASIDLAAARERGVTVCGTSSIGQPTAELAFGLMIDLARHISHENARLKAGEAWQSTVGFQLAGKTLGLLGLGKLGARVARFGKAFDMRVIAWSQNLTDERCREAGVERVGKEDLFRESDFLSIHVVLSERTRRLVGAAELELMKPSAFLINTSRGPIVHEAALLSVLQNQLILGAGLDVFDVEPLPRDHLLRTLPNVVITPHLGYVTKENYEVLYGETVEDIRAWLDGKPVRVLK
jgi:D-3-phosphoglycerate dehydrogenase